jgi:saccharopine dehydrogenase (NAD+, L-lysine-forming)
MSKVKIGVIREGKVPPDFRVPLTPQQCVQVMERFDDVEVVVQPSPIRKFKDDEYRALDVQMQEDISDCDILMGVKEVPIDQLIPSKTYLFFSHTIKKQPHNAGLMRSLLQKKVRMVDYETLKGPDGKRLIGFGRYAGIVGTYEGFRLFGKRHKLFDLKSPNDCEDRVEMESQMKKIQLPTNFKLVVSGFGRVGHGAEEILKLLPIKRVDAPTFFGKTSEPVYIHLDSQDYYERKEFGGFDKKDFYLNPEKYHSTLPDYVRRADMYTACHLWAGGNPVLLPSESYLHPDWKCKVIADISCDTNGPIASTIRASKISDPFFGYDPTSKSEVDFMKEDSVAVMAIDNLPCELPKDASEAFGAELIEKVLPLLLENDPHEIIWKATETTLEGELTPHFEYLSDYAKK